MEELFDLILSDGTVINGLQSDGQYFISDKKLTPADFSGRLSEVKIRQTNGPYADDIADAELRDLKQSGDKWLFRLHVPSPQELYRRQLDADRDMYLELLADQEYRLCLIEIGI